MQGKAYDEISKLAKFPIFRKICANHYPISVQALKLLYRLYVTLQCRRLGSAHLRGDCFDI